jgi:hypothetical protein
MATRAESIMAVVRAEMIARGVDVQHQWGKQREERHDRLPRVTWVEPDQDEEVEAPFATSYDAATDELGVPITGSRDVVYDRAVKLTVTVLAKTSGETETIMDVLLAAGRFKLTETAWTPGKIKKAGERPSSGPHTRTLALVVRLPVIDRTYGRGHIESVSIVNLTTTDGVPPPEED